VSGDVARAEISDFHMRTVEQASRDGAREPVDSVTRATPVPDSRATRSRSAEIRSQAR
jgi:hypothetical protein